MAREVPLISRDNFSQIAVTLKLWGKLHPTPDTPVILLADGTELSPRDIEEAMANFSSSDLKEERRNTKVIWKLFSVALHRPKETLLDSRFALDDDSEPLSAILGDFKQDIVSWSRDVLQ